MCRNKYTYPLYWFSGKKLPIKGGYVTFYLLLWICDMSNQPVDDSMIHVIYTQCAYWPILFIAPLCTGII